MTRALPVALATVAVLTLASSPSSAKCYSFKCEEKATAPSRQYITNTHRQILGDLYKPTPDRRTQIRDNHRRIIGYIEADGAITNTHRQKVGTIEGLAR